MLLIGRSGGGHLLKQAIRPAEDRLPLSFVQPRARDFSQLELNIGDTKTGTTFRTSKPPCFHGRIVTSRIVAIPTKRHKGRAR
jgi:hypothetical protein